MIRTRSRRADVYGAGPIGLTCAKLLAAGGWSVRLLGRGSRSSRPIALPVHTVDMIRDIWGLSLGSLSYAHPLAARSVSWSGLDVSDVAIAGLSVDAAQLCSALERHLCGVEIVRKADPDPVAMVIEASGPAPPSQCQLTAGSRVMAMWRDLPLDRRLNERTETLTGLGFWMFLLPTSLDRLSVQIATPSRELDHAQIAERLRQAPAWSLAGFLARNYDTIEAQQPVVMAIAPRLGPKMQEAERLLAGDRAMTFDPVSGDGTGQGIRSAMLAVGALNGLAEGVPARAILSHVTARHRFAMASHLGHCLEYYRTIAQSGYWAAEIAQTKAALSRLGAGNNTREDLLYLRHDPRTGPELVSQVLARR